MSLHTITLKVNLGCVVMFEFGLPTLQTVAKPRAPTPRIQPMILAQLTSLANVLDRYGQLISANSNVTCPQCSF